MALWDAVSKGFWTIGNVGVTPDMRPEEAKHIRILNILNMIPIMVTPLGIIYFISRGRIFPESVVVLALVMLPLFIFFINHRERYKAARIFAMILYSIFFMIQSLITGREIVDQYYFFILIAVTFLVFPDKEKKALIWTIVFTVICMFVVSILYQYVEPFLEFDPAFKNEINKLIVYTVFIVLIMDILISRHFTGMAEDQVQRLMVEKDHFLSMVSHDLRAPMTSIKGYTSILLEKSGKLEKERQEKYLNVISTESDRLIRLVTDLLDIQRMEAGRMDFDLQDVDLVTVVNDIVDSFQGAAMGKNVKVEKSRFEDGSKVSADKDRLSQVMANLLSNAIKFTPEGGRVKVDVSRISDGGKPKVKVSVSDNGPGIPKDYINKLFDRFQQAPQEKDKKSKGSGLGLALVREIVEHHGGTVGVESEPGKGSTFYFVLSMKKEVE